MDAIVPILPNANAGTMSGSKTAPEAADAGLFAGMISAVTPVAPVARRMGGSAANTTAQSPALTQTPSALTTQNTGRVASFTTESATPVLAKAGIQTGKGQAEALPSLSGDPGRAGNLANTAMPTPPSNAQPVDAPLQVAASASPLNQQMPNGQAGAPAIETPAVLPQITGQPVPTDASSAEPESGQTKSGNAEVGAAPKASAKSATPQTVTPSAVSPAAPAPAQAGIAAGIETVPTQAATNTASTANPVAMAAAQSASPNTTATQAAAAPIQAPEAGVQARRQAQGEPLTAQVHTKSNMKAATAGPTQASMSNQPKADAPQIPQPSAPAPATQAGQADAMMDPARLMQADPGRFTPLPQAIADPAMSDAPVEQDRIDLSSLRAAETSRAAERPGTAAGTARFTPATAGTLAAQIAAKFQNGERRFEIRMDPPELGRVEVRLQVGNDNRVQALLSAERPETLNDMRQYARELERALEEAGLQLDSDGLSFELTQDQDETSEDGNNQPGFHQIEFAEDEAGPVMAAAPPAELYGFRLNARSGVDIRL